MIVPVREVKRFMMEAMAAVGTIQHHAEQMADVLLAADYRGHYSHGLNRLGECRSLRALRGIWLLTSVESHPQF
jgi:LDH2 family malate/lactate/ureidoglycolate dehydrogenase